MILTCSFCHARYLISASVFSLGPRQVRCVRCSHSWQADLPNEIVAVGPPPDLDLSPIPETTLPIPPGSNLPAIRQNPVLVMLRHKTGLGTLVAVLAIFLLGAVLGRGKIIDTWPVTEKLYDALGLHLYQLGEGLSFIGVRSELRYDGGQTYLDVDGKILNNTVDAQAIPTITATAIGADGNALPGWQIDPPVAKVFAGEAVPFHSSIKAPHEAVTEINLNFVETKP